MSTTPCAVAYQHLALFYETKSYDEIDCRIISRLPMDTKGRSAFERIQTTKSYRTREILQKDPLALDPRVFRPLYEASRDVLAWFKSNGKTLPQAAVYFSGEAARDMCQALEALGYSSRAFQNTMDDIVRNNNTNQSNTATIVMMLFLSAAFFHDPNRCLPEFHKAIKQVGLQYQAGTGVLEDQSIPSTSGTFPLLGLMRRYPDGHIGSEIYRLNPDEDGTVVGRSVTGNSCINDVEASVSRTHLRLFRQGLQWYAQGQRSSNGTVLFTADGRRVVIEEAGAPSRGPLPEPIPINPGDSMILGQSTRFEIALLGFA